MSVKTEDVSKKKKKMGGTFSTNIHVTNIKRKLIKYLFKTIIFLYKDRNFSRYSMIRKINLNWLKANRKN